ncbi:MFS transporter [Streptomyces sp. NPDC101165]|uniref:MFS transporter n=1 Tax=Streptomyces sp. NPDC101165 TaxID=3366119 RepID=UPI0037F243E5
MTPDDGAVRRTLKLLVLVNTVGNGMYMTAGVLYFLRVTGLSAAQVGAGLSIAGLVALSAGVPVGHLADRRGARGVYAATLVAGGLGMASFLLVHGFWQFLAVACLCGLAQNAGAAARGPIVRAYGGERPQRFRAQLRVVTNIGISAGAVLAGAVVQADTRTAYVLLIAGNAVSFLAAAAMTLAVPSPAPVPPGPAGPSWTAALRDRPFVLVTALDGMMSIQFRVVTVLFPLWAVTHTAAPRWIVGAGMLANTALVVACQVRASRGVDSPSAASAAMRRAGLAFVLACGVFAAAQGTPGWAAALLLLTGMTVHTLGELWHSAAGFELSYALAPEHATGQYLGLWGMGMGLGGAFAPALLTTLCVSWGRPGWAVVGALFLFTGLLSPAATRWAVRTRPRADAEASAGVVAGG